MTDAKQTPPSPDDEVLKHFRDHSSGEPPAPLDAFILATAHREAPAPKPSLWQRWLRACQQPRWQVAFASLVGVALMLALVQRTPEQLPSYDFAPAPKASAPLAKPEAAARPQAAPMADFAAPMQRESINSEMADEAKLSKRAAAPVKSLDDQLREVIRLQDAGQTQAAEALMTTLHKRFPKENLAAKLKELQKK
ncbi:hypothetical protein C5612_26505 [Pseudomonas frederiksbergensis]|uniref:Uncharacterized protein n=1 Tax=Pseudomonas frederiksbergensis TaxID=104087 RepID=A0A2S8H9B9_9PSED|nr:hypothetical protein [Pseudomonas frederiksbergensis]PQO99092.1 hypothetical protein C5612_26505 [Pseudomonas frederiksbergensis]